MRLVRPAASIPASLGVQSRTPPADARSSLNNRSPQPRPDSGGTSGTAAKLRRETAGAPRVGTALYFREPRARAFEVRARASAKTTTSRDDRLLPVDGGNRCPQGMRDGAANRRTDRQ